VGLRIVFAGSPAIAVPALKAVAALCADDPSFELAAVLTNPDSAKGRKGDLTPTDVSAAAAEIDAGAGREKAPPIQQFKFESLKTEAREAVAALKPDILVSFAYGKIFGPRFLALFPLGGVNVHPSLLPAWRGASPIQAAILAGEKETGVTIQRLAAEMDTGAILAQEKIALTGRETAESLGETAAALAAEMLPAVLRSIADGTALEKPQEGTPSWCPRFTKEDGRINWSLSAAEIDRRVRAFTPWPLCFTECNGEVLYILEGAPLPDDGTLNAAPGKVLKLDKKQGILIGTGGGVFAATRLQWRAKKALDWKAFMNGARGLEGAVLR